MSNISKAHGTFLMPYRLLDFSRQKSHEYGDQHLLPPHLWQPPTTVFPFCIFDIVIISLIQVKLCLFLFHLNNVFQDYPYCFNSVLVAECECVFAFTLIDYIIFIHPSINKCSVCRDWDLERTHNFPKSQGMMLGEEATGTVAHTCSRRQGSWHCSAHLF